MEKGVCTLLEVLVATLTAAALVVGGAPHDLPPPVLEGEPLGPVTTGDVKWLPVSKNPHCKVEKEKAERCGVKDLNPKEGDGLLMWKPERCSDTGCKCVPVREVQVRQQAEGEGGNAFAKALKRYRIFECA